MKNDLVIKNGVVIPHHELEITASRSGGPGGQHVNKSDTRITIRWNVKTTTALTEEQKARVIKNLEHKLTADGDLIVHNSESRSQQQNKEKALEHLANIVRRALYVPKKRIATKVSKTTKEKRFQQKKHRSDIKKSRRIKIFD